MTTRYNGSVVQLRMFECVICGAKAPATKTKHFTSVGHEKDMLCIFCKDITKHIQTE